MTEKKTSPWFELAVSYFRESNAIEDVYSDEALAKSIDAWTFLLGKPSLDKKTLLEAHRLMCQGIIGNDRQPGEFRDHDVFVGGHRCPSPEAVPGLIADWISKWGLIPHAGFATGDFDDMNDFNVARHLALVAHLGFENIHPFSDGNGRMGRLLLLWHTEKAGVKPFLFTKHDARQTYYPLFAMREAGIL